MSRRHGRMEAECARRRAETGGACLDEVCLGVGWCDACLEAGSPGRAGRMREACERRKAETCGECMWEDCEGHTPCAYVRAAGERGEGGRGDGRA